MFWKIAFRQIRNQPALAATVVVTLALAIGANAAIFSFVNALLIRPFPFADPDQLVEIHSMRGGQQGKLSMREVLDIREQVSILSGVAAHSGGAGGYNYSGEGRPQEWRAILTTGNLFEVLGVPLAAGAVWPDSANRDRDFRVILSHDLWQSAFGGKPGIVGQKIVLDHAAGYVIHGVAPPELDFPHGTQVFRSIGGFTNYERRTYRNVVAIARIARPHGVERLQAELDAVSGRLAELYPETNAGLTLRAVTFRNIYSGDVRPYLLVLSGAVAFVLLIACGNVVNLLLSRAVSRGKEMSVRLALGAGSQHLIRQLLSESLVLALLSGLGGLLLAYWWMRALRGTIGVEMPAWMQIGLDGRVLAFTLGISLLAGILSGLAPALLAMRASLSDALRESSRGGSASRFATRLRDAMVVGEIAVAVTLLAGTGQMIESFLRLQESDSGFSSADVSTFRVALGWKRYINQTLISGYYEKAQHALEAVPGFTKVAFGPNPPLARQEETTPGQIEIEGQSIDEIRRNPYVVYQSVSENYFDALRIPIKAGRSFSPFDQTSSAPVAIVSSRLAERLWPGANPVGRRIRMTTGRRDPPWLEVVGVSGDVAHRQLGGESALEVFYPYRQSAESNQYFLIRTKLPLAQVQQKAEEALWAIDPEQSVFDFKTYEQRVLDSVWQLRLSRTLLLLFGLVGLVLAAIGAYGVLSYSAKQRRREFGIRLALGATPSSIQSVIIRRAVLLSAIGLAIGTLGAVGLTQLMRAQLPGLASNGLQATGLAAIVLLSVSVAAAALPAWRASRTDPAVTLRVE